MALRSPRPCRYAGCGALCRDGTGFCAIHNGWDYQGRGTAAQRGYGKAWRLTRKSIIHRDKGLCQACKRNGRIERGTDVDHILPKAQGGAESHDNLELLCIHCHRTKTAGEGHGGGRGG